MLQHQHQEAASPTSSPCCLPYTLMLPPQAASPTSPPCWPPTVWPTQDTRYWRNCNLEGSLSSRRRGRVSCSSTSSSSSYEDIYSDDIDDNNNNNSIIELEQLQGSGKGSTTICGQDTINFINTDEDPNNNINDTEEYISNNNNIGSENTKRTKTSAPRARVVDDDGFIRRAASVCVDETETKVLLVSSKKDSSSWLVPGGGVEAGEDIAAAAMREAWEEAGVEGNIDRYLGLFETQHHSGRKRHRTAVFVVRVAQVLSQYPEAHLGRQREWFPIEEALMLLSRHRPLQSAYLQLLLVSHLKVPPA